MSATAALLISGGIALSKIISSALAARSQRIASETQSGAASDAIQTQMDALQAMTDTFQPYINAGVNATNSMEALSGALGPEAQQAAIDSIQNGPQFQSMLQQGENSILQNASATGGLRGGNTQAALGTFAPQLLSQLINDQFTNLGGIAGMGLNAAGNVGSLGMQGASNISGFQLDKGAYDAGGALARGGFWAGLPGAFTEGLGTYLGLTSGGGLKGGKI